MIKYNPPNFNEVKQAMFEFLPNTNRPDVFIVEGDIIKFAKPFMCKIVMFKIFNITSSTDYTTIVVNNEYKYFRMLQ